MQALHRPTARLAVIPMAVTAMAITLVAGCASTQRNVRSDYDRTADFSQYRTYGIMPEAGRSPTGADYSTLIAKRIEAAVRREMEARGYVPSPTPDLLVNFRVTVEEKQDITTVPSAGPPVYNYRYGAYGAWPAYSYDTWVREYKEGTLLLDVVDARRQQLVWEAAGTGRVTKDKLDNLETTINNAVSALFERYPFRAGSGVAAATEPRS